MSETVELPKAELYEMLDAANEMIGFCAGRMPTARYKAVANSVWVIANRASGNDRIADLLLAELRKSRERYFADDVSQNSVLQPQERLAGLINMAVPSADAFNHLSPAGFRVLFAALTALRSSENRVATHSEDAA